ncbi:MAG: transcription elongation factor GreA [Gammaproteobacteria bacterium]|nr:transcription elongation factor GreA [Gammaproteobacteria bacterium]
MPAPLTVAGAEKLRTELEALKNERGTVSRAIGDARKLGDLSENADYHAAKEKQGLMEARIRFIEAKLAAAQVIDVSKIENTGTVIFGATVTLEDLEAGTQVRYRIVGEDESDVRAGLISNISPLARAMMGKKVQQSFYVGEGVREKEWLILAVEHI